MAYKKGCSCPDCTGCGSCSCGCDDDDDKDEE